MKKLGYRFIIPAFLLVFTFMAASLKAQDRPPTTGQLNENFDSPLFPPLGWTAYDRNEDENNWFEFNVGAEGSVEGENVAGSRSYDPDEEENLQPDNWLVTPPLYVDDGNILNFWYAAQDPNYDRETLTIYVNQGSNDPEDILDDGDEVVTLVTESDEWQQGQVELDDYTTGEEIYIAFRHHDTEGQFLLKLDAITGPQVMKFIDPFGLSEPETGGEILVNSDDDRTLSMNFEMPDNNLDDPEYIWLLDEEGEDFSEPVFEAVSSETPLEISSSALYDTLAARGVEAGESFDGQWTVRVVDGNEDPDDIYRYAEDPHDISLIRAEIEPFALNAPDDNTEWVLDEQEEFSSSWYQTEMNPQHSLKYFWHLTDEEGDFNDPLITVEANNDAADTTLTIKDEDLDQQLAAIGVDEHETFEGRWTVTAEHEESGVMKFSEDTLSITISRGEEIVSVEQELVAEQPEGIILKQNFPNPFNPSTEIQYQIPEQARVTLTVYDITGRQVEVLVDETQSAGTHAVRFDASALSSGTYIYRLQAGEVMRTRQMMFLK